MFSLFDVVFSVCISLLLVQALALHEDYDCGESSSGIPSAPQERVLNGRNISIGDFPWLVSIRDNAHRGFCGGSIVSANYILTAAHCLASKKDLDHVLVGEIDNTLSNAQTIKIEKTYTHPSYQSSSSLDVGIIKLAEPLTFTKNVRPVCLPTNYTDYYHQEVSVIGWGYSKETFDICGGKLRANWIFARVQRCFQKTLQKHMTLNATFVLVGSIGELRVNIKGDSGSPMQDNYKGRWWQVGITSYGVLAPIYVDPTHYRDVGAYTRVTTGCDWIKEITQGEVKCLDMFKEPLIPEPTPSEAA